MLHWTKCDLKLLLEFLVHHHDARSQDVDACTVHAQNRQ